MPDVEQFPVIRITLRDAADEALLTGYQRIADNTSGNFSAVRGTMEHTIVNNEAIRQNEAFWGGEIPTALPENNPLTYAEALDITESECARLFGDVQLSVEQASLLGRVYRFKIIKGQREWLDPVTEKGYYFFVLHQGFRGIEYEASLECYDVLRLPNEDYMNSPYACFSLYDVDAYSCHITLRQEVDTMADNVPILPFTRAKAAIEQEILAGHLRSVDTVKLCYAPYYDPGDTSLLWLLPVWYVKGAYTRSPSLEFQPFTDSTGAVVDSGVPCREVVFEAQRGTLMAYDDSRATRRKAPDILTWDDVH